MSFSSDVKHEISQQEVRGSQAKAILCALFLVRASLNLSNKGMYISFQTENAATAKYVYQLLRNEFDADVQLSVLKKMNLKKNNVYRLHIYGKTDEILEELTIMQQGSLYETPSYKLVRSEKNARAFLQGAFLAAGSINHPKTSNYHLEMAFPSQNLAQTVEKLLNRFHIPSRITQRKGQVLVYTKAGDKIADFLRLVGASESLFAFEDTRIQRDFYNQITRLDNCEVANEMKTIKAAQEQLEWIALLESCPQISIPEKIRHVMEARKQNPEASMVELCEAVSTLYGETISKSGMKHRLAKIRELASPLQAQPK